MPDENSQVNPRTMRRRGLLVGALTIPVMIVVEHFSDLAKARAAGVAFAMMVTVIVVFWYLRREIWYWFVVGALAVAQVALVIIVPWTSKAVPAPELWPIGIADFAALCGFIKLMEKIINDARKRHPSI